MFTALAAADAVIPLDLVVPMPGFAEAKGWQLSNWGEVDSPFKLLSAEGDEAPAFVVVEPGLFYPDLQIELDETTVDQLNIETTDDVALLVILTLGEDLASTTANLLGPIVVNVKNNRAVQMIRTNTEDTTRELLFAAQ